MTVRAWLAVLVAVAVAGCGKPRPAETQGPTAREAENPWAKAASALRKETDVATCRRVLTDLTTAASGAGSTPLPPLPDADRKPLQIALGLTDDDAREIAGASFTALDAAHLAECFYLRDVAATLDAGGQPAAVKAARALALIGRQVQRVPFRGANSGTPPAFTLRRGTGTGLDRATAFAALCRQLDLDAFLIAPPSVNAWPPADAKPDQPTPEPFWAVGVRDGAAILLYDPIRGLPVPGPTPGTPATLAEVKANPDLLKPWAADKVAPLPSADEIKASVPFACVPMSAVSARMTVFQQSAGNELGVRAAVNWARLKKDAEPTGAALTAWTPPAFPLTPARSQREFLSVTDGGTADLGRTPWLRDYLLGQMPPFPQVANAEFGFQEQYFSVTRGGYARAVIDSAPRERLQRGQYQDVTQLLVKLREQYRALTELAGGDPTRNAAVAQWIEQVNVLYQKLGVAKLDAGSSPEGAAAVRRLEIDLQKKWSEKEVGTLVAATVAEPVLQETTYLLALAKHEQAERAQLAAGKGDAEKRDAAGKWAEANGWWQRYQPLAEAQDKAFPGRAAHAQALIARAAAFR